MYANVIMTHARRYTGMMAGFVFPIEFNDFLSNLVYTK